MDLHIEANVDVVHLPFKVFVMLSDNMSYGIVISSAASICDGSKVVL